MARSRARPWEGSKADNKIDRAEAKRRGVSVKQFEGSAADRRLDAAAQRKKKKKKKKPGSK